MSNLDNIYSLIVIDKVAACISRYHRGINCATKAFNMKFFHIFSKVSKILRVFVSFPSSYGKLSVALLHFKSYGLSG